MKKLLVACAMLLVFCSTVVNAQNRTAPSTQNSAVLKQNDFLIVPGSRIGTLKLGMTRGQVLSTFPYHRSVVQHSFGVEEISFFYTNFNEQYAIISALLMKGKVVQIATDDKKYSASGGFNTGTPMGEWMAKYRGGKTRTYYFGREKTTLYCNASYGLTLSVSQSSREFSSMMGSRWVFPRFVAVHWPNQLAIPIWNKQRGVTSAPPRIRERQPVRVNLNARQRRAAQNTLRALKRLESVVNFGTTYSDYSQRLVNTKVTFDENVWLIPNSDLKSALTSAMNNYASARSSWSSKIDNAEMDMISNLSESLMQRSWSSAARDLRVAEQLLR